MLTEQRKNELLTPRRAVFLAVQGKRLLLFLLLSGAPLHGSFYLAVLTPENEGEIQMASSILQDATEAPQLTKRKQSNDAGTATQESLISIL